MYFLSQKFIRTPIYHSRDRTCTPKSVSWAEKTKSLEKSRAIQRQMLSHFNVFKQEVANRIRALKNSSAHVTFDAYGAQNLCWAGKNIPFLHFHLDDGVGLFARMTTSGTQLVLGDMLAEYEAFKYLTPLVAEEYLGMDHIEWIREMATKRINFDPHEYIGYLNAVKSGPHLHADFLHQAFVNGKAVNMFLTLIDDDLPKGLQFRIWDGVYAPPAKIKTAA